MERCRQRGVLGAVGLPAVAWCGGVGLGWFSLAAEGPEEASALKLSLAGSVGEVPEEGLAVYQLSYGQRSDLIHSLIVA